MDEETWRVYRAFAGLQRVYGEVQEDVGVDCWFYLGVYVFLVSAA